MTRRQIFQQDAPQGIQSKSVIIGASTAIGIVTLVVCLVYLAYWYIFRRRYQYEKLGDGKLEYRSLMQDRSPTQNQKIKSGYNLEKSSSSSSNKSANKETIRSGKFKPYHLASMYGVSNSQDPSHRKDYGAYKLVAGGEDNGSTIKPNQGTAFNFLSSRNLFTSERKDQNKSSNNGNGVFQSVNNYFNGGVQNNQKLPQNPDEYYVTSYTQLGALKDLDQNHNNEDFQESLSVMKQKLAYLQSQRQQLESKSQLMTNISADGSYRNNKNLLLQGYNTDNYPQSEQGQDHRESQKTLNSIPQRSPMHSQTSNQSPFSYLAQNYTTNSSASANANPVNPTTSINSNGSQKFQGTQLPGQQTPQQSQYALPRNTSNRGSGTQLSNNLTPGTAMGNPLNYSFLNHQAQSIGMQFKSNMSQIQQQYQQMGQYEQSPIQVNYIQPISSGLSANSISHSKELLQRSRDDSEVGMNSNQSGDSGKSQGNVLRMQKAQGLDKQLSQAHSQSGNSPDKQSPEQLSSDNIQSQRSQPQANINNATQPGLDNQAGRLERGGSNNKSGKLVMENQYSLKEIVSWIDERLESNNQPQDDAPGETQVSQNGPTPEFDRREHKAQGQNNQEQGTESQQHVGLQSDGQKHRYPSSLAYQTITEEDIEDLNLGEKASILANANQADNLTLNLQQMTKNRDGGGVPVKQDQAQDKGKQAEVLQKRNIGYANKAQGDTSEKAIELNNARSGQPSVQQALQIPNKVENQSSNNSLNKAQQVEVGGRIQPTGRLDRRVSFNVVKQEVEGVVEKPVVSDQQNIKPKFDFSEPTPSLFLKTPKESIQLKPQDYQLGQKDMHSPSEKLPTDQLNTEYIAEIHSPQAKYSIQNIDKVIEEYKPDGSKQIQGQINKVKSKNDLGDSIQAGNAKEDIFKSTNEQVPDPQVQEGARPTENKFFKQNFSDSKEVKPLQPKPQPDGALNKTSQPENGLKNPKSQQSAVDASLNLQLPMPDIHDSNQFDIFASLNNYTHNQEDSQFLQKRMDLDNAGARNDSHEGSDASSVQFNLNNNGPQAFIASSSHSQASSLHSSQTLQNKDLVKASKIQPGPLPSKQDTFNGQVNNSQPQQQQQQQQQQQSQQQQQLQQATHQLMPQASVQYVKKPVSLGARSKSQKLRDDGQGMFDDITQEVSFVGSNKPTALSIPPQEQSQAIQPDSKRQLGAESKGAPLGVGVGRTKSTISRVQSKNLQKDKHILQAIIDEKKQNKVRQLHEQDEQDDLTSKLDNSDQHLMTQSDMGDHTPKSVANLLQNIVQQDQDVQKQVEAAQTQGQENGGEEKVIEGVQKAQELYDSQIPAAVKVKPLLSTQDKNARREKTGENSIFELLGDGKQAATKIQDPDQSNQSNDSNHQMTPVVTPPSFQQAKGYGSYGIDQQGEQKLQSIFVPELYKNDDHPNFHPHHPINKSQSSIGNYDLESILDQPGKKRVNFMDVEEPKSYDARGQSRKGQQPYGMQESGKSGILNALSLKNSAEIDTFKSKVRRHKSMVVPFEDDQGLLSTAKSFTNSQSSKPQGKGLMKMMSFTQKSKK